MDKAYIKNLVNDADALKKEAQATNLKTAITNYMSVLAANNPENRLPNGMTAEQAAESVINGAEYYVRIRNRQLDSKEAGMELTVEEVRGQIAEQLQNMTVEQGIQYVAMLKMMYRYFMPAEEVDVQQAVKEYQQMTQFYGDKRPEEQLDDLIDSLELSDLHSVLHFAEGISVDIKAGQFDDQAFSLIQKAVSNYMEVEDVVICGAVMYGEAVKGNVTNLSPQADPGVVTVVSAAYLDAMQTCTKQELAQELYGRLSAFGKLLASGLTVATAMCVIGMAFTAAPEIGVLLASLGASEAIADAGAVLFFLGVSLTQLPMSDDYKIAYSGLIGGVERMIRGRNEQPVAAEAKKASHDEAETNHSRELLPC